MPVFMQAHTAAQLSQFEARTNCKMNGNSKKIALNRICGRCTMGPDPSPNQKTCSLWHSFISNHHTWRRLWLCLTSCSFAFLEQEGGRGALQFVIPQKTTGAHQTVLSAWKIPRWNDRHAANTKIKNASCMNPALSKLVDCSDTRMKTAVPVLTYISQM